MPHMSEAVSVHCEKCSALVQKVRKYQKENRRLRRTNHQLRLQLKSEYCFIKKQLWLSEDYITVKVNSNVQSISFQTDYSTATSSNGEDDMEMDEEMDEEMDDESDEDEVMNDIAEESINLEDSEDEGNYLGSDRDYASLEDVDTEYSTADEEQQSRNKVM